MQVDHLAPQRLISLPKIMIRSTRERDIAPAAITLTLLCLKLNVRQNHLEGLLKNKSLGSEFLNQ